MRSPAPSRDGCAELDSADVGPDTAEAIAASRSGSFDFDVDAARGCVMVRWGRAGRGAACSVNGRRPAVAAEVAEVLRSGEPTVLMVGGECHPRRGARGGSADRRGHRGPVAVRDVPDALGAWGRRPRSGTSGLLRRGRRSPAGRGQASGARRRQSPVSFFAYPGKPSDLVPAGCEVHVLTEYSGAANALDGAGRRAGTRHGCAGCTRVASATTDRCLDFRVGG